MPYLIMSKRLHAVTDKPGCDDWLVHSRRAVATLEEAQLHADLIVAERFRQTTSEYIAASENARCLPSSGGVIGPLPDGTIIEVDQVTFIELLRVQGKANVNSLDLTNEQIIDAFNAQQGQN